MAMAVAVRTGAPDRAGTRRRYRSLTSGADLLLAVGADHVERLEGVVDVDAEPRPGGPLVLGRDVGGVARQVADVPDARLDDVARAQISGDLVRLRRGTPR